jgi:hypothetical protein
MLLLSACVSRPSAVSCIVLRLVSSRRNNRSESCKRLRLSCVAHFAGVIPGRLKERNPRFLFKFAVYWCRLALAGWTKCSSLSCSILTTLGSDSSSSTNRFKQHELVVSMCTVEWQFSFQLCSGHLAMLPLRVAIPQTQVCNLTLNKPERGTCCSL